MPRLATRRASTIALCALLVAAVFEAGVLDIVGGRSTVLAQQPGADALVAAYAFDEATGATTADASGRGHTGTIAGAQRSAAGHTLGALSFDGAGDWVTIADTAALDLTTGLTVQAWVRPTTLSGWRTVLMKEAGAGLAYALYAHDNAPRPAVYGHIGADQAVLGTSALALNAWTHLAASYDGATFRLYVNGLQVAGRALTGAFATSADPLRIGGNAPWGEFFSGLIDDVRIHNRALTAQEIQSLMNTPVGVQPPGFQIVAYNPVLSVGLSDTVTFNFELTPVGGFTAATVPSVTGLPAGATGSWVPPEGPPHPGPFALNVTTSATTPPGTYPLTIGSTAGTISATTTVTLIVVGNPDFRVVSEPNSLIVTQGTSGVVSYQLQPANGYTGNVTMSVPGLPSGVATTFLPASLIPPGAGTLQFNVGATAAPGSYPLQITGADGAITRQASFSLTIAPPGAGGSWRQLPLGDTAAVFYGAIVGDIGNTGSNRVIASGGDGVMYDYNFNGSTWTATQMPVGQFSDGEMHNMGIGPGRNDGINRLYIAAALSGRVYEVSRVAGAWQSSVIATLTGATDIIIGDGRNDGVNRIYVSWMSGTSELTRAGNVWQTVTMSAGETGWVHGIDLGQPRNDGLNRIVTANQGNGDAYEYFWNGTAWTKTLIDAAGTDSRNIEIGTGRNDGVNRVYVCSGDGNTYEYTRNGTAWQKVTMGDNGVVGVKVHCIPARARSDGLVRVYVAASDGGAYEFDWSGTAWRSTRLGAATAYMYGLAVGDGLNNGTVQVYGSSYDGQAYLFQWMANTPVTVPNVVGLPQTDAAAALGNAGLGVATPTFEASTTTPLGAVIRQNPAADTLVPSGTLVSLVISSGPPPVMVAVPTLLNSTEQVARNALTAVRLTAGTVTSALNAVVPAGLVASQTPAPDTLVAEGTSVAFVISLGGVAVPALVNQTEVAARSRLSLAGLGASPVTTANSQTVPSGSVISQTPAAGTVVAPGSNVGFVVSAGPSPGPGVDRMVFSDGQGTRTITAFSTTGPRVLVAFALADGPAAGGQRTTVTGAGLTWTLVRRVNARLGTTDVWAATATGPLTNVSVRSTLRFGGFDQSLTVVAFSGASGVGASATANAATGAPSVTLTTLVAGSLVYAAGNDWDRAAARTLPAGQVLVRQWLDTAAGDTFWIQAAGAPIANAGTVVRLNVTAPTNDRWNFAIVEIRR